MCRNACAVVELLMHDMGLQLKLLCNKELNHLFKIQNMLRAVRAQLWNCCKAVFLLYCAGEGCFIVFFCQCVIHCLLVK